MSYVKESGRVTDLVVFCDWRREEESVVAQTSLYRFIRRAPSSHSRCIFPPLVPSAQPVAPLLQLPEPLPAPATRPAMQSPLMTVPV